jgi:hypothetical protein
MARQRLAPRCRGDSSGKSRTSMPLVQVDFRAAVPRGASKQLAAAEPTSPGREFPNHGPRYPPGRGWRRPGHRFSLLGKKHRYAHRRHRSAHTRQWVPSPSSRIRSCKVNPVGLSHVHDSPELLGERGPPSTPGAGGEHPGPGQKVRLPTFIEQSRKTADPSSHTPELETGPSAVALELVQHVQRQRLFEA